MPSLQVFPLFAAVRSISLKNNSTLKQFNAFEIYHKFINYHKYIIHSVKNKTNRENLIK